MRARRDRVRGGEDELCGGVVKMEVDHDAEING